MNTIFTENKYKRWYFSIIDRSISEGRKYDSSLHEKHHIIPTSLGGTNDPKNITTLTFREHFLCHILLTKFTISNDKTKMHCALRMMMNKSKLNHRVLSQKQYEMARSALAKIKRKMSPEFCEKQSLNHTGTKNPMSGKKQTQKQKDVVTNLFSKTYKFILNGQEITVTNLKKYCEENKLTRGKMSALYQNKITKYKNYTGINFGHIC
jgi:hypothetical protein